MLAGIDFKAVTEGNLAFKHILVPTLSQDTVARAVSLAKEVRARLALFYAEPPSPAAYAELGAISSARLTQEVHQRLDSAAHDILDAAQAVASAVRVNTQRVVLVGRHPYERIIQAAESQGCDLIFMASHG